MKIALAAACALLAAPFAAQALTPVGYTFDQPTSCGTYCYHDSSGSELIDGLTGYAGWGVDGAGPWVGWYQKPVVNIDFDLGVLAHVSSVRIGTTQDNLSDVVLPSIDVSAWNGSSWQPVASLEVPESGANDHDWQDRSPHGWLALDDLSFDAQKVRITARFSSDGPWTFIDEVQFNAAAVPEPGTWALMALGLGVTALRRRRRG